jgi:potassium efflux system protein
MPNDAPGAGVRLRILNGWRLILLGTWFFAGQGWCAQLVPKLDARGAEIGVSNAPALATPSVEARLVEARANLTAALAPGQTSITNAPASISPQELSARRTLLQRLVRVYEQQLSANAELESAKNRKAASAREAQSWARFNEPLPYTLHLVDRLREEIQAERVKISKGDTANSLLEKLVEQNRSSLKEAEEKIRQLNEELEKSADAMVTERLLWQRDLERLRSQVAVAVVGMLELERSIRTETLAASRIHLGLLQKQVLIAEAGAVFTQAELEQTVARLEAEREKLDKELSEAQARQIAAANALTEAREALELMQTRTDVTSGGLLRASEMAGLRETELQTAETSIRVFRLLLECGNAERHMWEQRFAAFDSRNSATLNASSWRRRILNDRLNLWAEHENQELEVSSSQVQLQETRLSNLVADSELWLLAQQRLKALQERDQLVLRLSRNISQAQRLGERWGETLLAAENKLPFAGKVENLFFGAGSFLQRLWTFEIFTAEDTITVEGQKLTGKRSITIGKIILALLILGVGYWTTGLLTRLIEPFFIRRLKIEPNQASLIRRWLRTVLVVCLVLFSLISVKIPLTVFAFAGGALAIGLGFGTQTLLKNFVSGLIILFERPFRVGDVLDVGGQRGTVTGIGLRASVLQLWDGTETLIPNSNLLENNLSNWTYSNRTVRFSITANVAYGTDPRRVLQLLGEVAERHGLVEKDPKPQVFFVDFANSSLAFELRFWVDVSRANAAQVSSDLRMMIAGLFTEHGIVFAFPQRDIHLDTSHPLSVQVVPGTQFTLSPSR